MWEFLIRTVDGVTILSIFAFFLSIISIYLQYRKGELFVASVKTVGFRVHFTSTKSDEEPLTGDATMLFCVVPVLTYATGSKPIQLSDFVLMADFTDTVVRMNSNHFMKDIGEDGRHVYPTPQSWVHQILVKPKDTSLHYVEFVTQDMGDEVSEKVKRSLENMRGVTFTLEITSCLQEKCTTDKLKFTVNGDEIKANKYGWRYTTYAAGRGSFA